MSDLQTLTQKIEALEQRVARDLARRRKANTTTVIGGAVLFILILGYFTWIHSLISEVARPESVAANASELLKGQLPDVMASLQTELKEIAPKVVAEVRLQSVQAMPDIRKWMESEAVSKAEPYVVALEKEMGTVIQQGIVSDREAFDAFVKDPENPEAQKRFREVVHKSVKSYFDDPMVQADLKSYAEVLKAYDIKLKRLRDGSDLSPDEKLERDLILSVRELARRSEKPVEFNP